MLVAAYRPRTEVLVNLPLFLPGSSHISDGGGSVPHQRVLTHMKLVASSFSLLWLVSPSQAVKIRTIKIFSLSCLTRFTPLRSKNSLILCRAAALIWSDSSFSLLYSYCSKISLLLLLTSTTHRCRPASGGWRRLLSQSHADLLK